MPCYDCAGVPAPPQKHNYLLYLFDSEQMKLGWCIVQSECPHGMQEFITELAREGLVVHDRVGEKFTMYHPEVIKIDEKAAAHVPIVDPAPS